MMPALIHSPLTAHRRTALHCTLIVLAALVSAPAAAEEPVSLYTQTVERMATAVPEPTAPAAPAEQPDAKLFSGGPTPSWIWGGPAADKDHYFLRTQFTVSEKKPAHLIASADNHLVAYLNGQRVLSSDAWETGARADVSKQLRQGENELLVEVRNDSGPAGLVAKLVIGQGESAQHVISDEGWQAAKQKAGPYKSVVTIGKLGISPWNNPFAAPVLAANPAGRDQFNVPAGFRVEKLFTVPKAELGSWVSIAFDDKGRLLASDQGNQGLCRVTLPPLDGGDDAETTVERLNVDITSAQGMLHAFGSLYVSVNGGPGSGFYRVKDTDGDDYYDEVVLLKKINGGGEHGPHALRLSPDGKSIFLIAGNHTDLPPGITSTRVPSNWDEDLLLPRQWDARGHARGKLAPGGWICRTDPAGKTWDVYSIGYRNPYDMDFNADGELFAYDADMEWDMGSPWYRPTRVVHATSGSEFGWRSGTGKWPTWYVDSLPPAVDIGPGSPVGVTFGYGTRFPARYQNALYLLDWTFGTMYAIHLTPDGASYKGKKEEFLSRVGLPLTDAAVGPDGALYFTVGGRGTQSELYRVVYEGDASTEPAVTRHEAGAELRAVRRELETLHSQPDLARLDFIWSHLNHEDRFIRFAARTALEHLPVAEWGERALAEQDPHTLITAMVAFARQADKGLQDKALASLRQVDLAGLTREQRLELLRVYQLVFTRMGPPSASQAQQLAARLDPLYPAENDDPMNRELVNLLVYLNAPTVIDKTLALMAQPSTQSAEDLADLLARNRGYGETIARMLADTPELQKIHYALALRNMRYGWTLDQRRTYFAWLDQARERSGGASYQGFIDNIRKEAVENLSPAEKEALASTTTAPPPKPTELPKPQGPGHAWTLDEFLEITSDGLTGRDFENGKRTFAAARCIVCHRFDGNGGATGPDVTNVAARFSLKDFGEALLEPSKVISDQYRASTVFTTGGKVITGRIVNNDDGKLTVMTDPEDATKIVEIPSDEVDEVTPSKTSLMPADLLKPLNREEVLDLTAYILSRGNPDDPMFAK